MHSLLIVRCNYRVKDPLSSPPKFFIYLFFPELLLKETDIFEESLEDELFELRKLPPAALPEELNFIGSLLSSFNSYPLEALQPIAIGSINT